LVSCAPAAVDAVLAIFKRHGFADAAVVGEITAAQGASRLVVN
jgi:selenide, water dikinase